MALASKKCVPCKGSIPPLSKVEAERMMDKVEGWVLIDEASKLSRSFSFPNFAEAQVFANRVGELSEMENHHPVISYSWGWCSVVFYTHKIGGLHENDFIMAAKLNAMTSA